MGGQLDPGRLAAARLLYERAGSAPQRSSAASAAARSAAVAAAASAAAPASSSSAPASRQASTVVSAHKRRRDDASDEERDDSERDDSSSHRGSDAENDSTRTPGKRRRSDKHGLSSGAASSVALAAAAADSHALSQPPPLETATGTLASAAASTSAADAPAFISDTFALANPLSSLITPPQTPTAPLDPRDKSRNMIRDALIAAQQQSESSITAAAGDSSVSAAEPAAAASSFSGAAATAAAAASAPVADPTRLADRIESHLFGASGCVVDVSYGRKLRDLVFNMKGNAPLCMRLLRGDLQADEFVRLDYHSLASASVAAERDRLRQENFDASVYRPPTRVDTADYKCASCGSNRCSTIVIREERDISKADTWGSKQGAGSVIEIRCEDCKTLWTKEE